MLSFNLTNREDLYIEGKTFCFLLTTDLITNPKVFGTFNLSLHFLDRVNIWQQKGNCVLAQLASTPKWTWYNVNFEHFFTLKYLFKISLKNLSHFCQISSVLKY